MSVSRIYPIYSNTIASGTYSNINSSQSPITEIWFGGGGEDSAIEKRNSISRFIVKFDLSELQSKINSFDINPNLVNSYRLKMKNAIPRDKVLEPEYEFNKLNKIISSSYDLICFPINKDWDAGRGYDLYKDNFLIKQQGYQISTGYSNWNNATMSNSWDEQGIFINPTASTSIYSTQHFSIGDEDINFDITNIVKNWLSGSPNYGLCVTYRHDYELLTTSTRSIASFYTEKTNSSYKPYIEILSNQNIVDDRNNISNNRVSRLFLYTFNGTEPANYFSANTVVLKQGQNIISAITPTHLEKGVYYIDVYLPNNKIGDKFYDIWSGITFNPGFDQQDIIQEFRIKDNYYTSNTPKINNYNLSIYGIDEGCVLSNEENIRVYCDLRVNYSTQSPSTLYDLQYRLIMNNQDEVIPWTSINQIILNGCKTNYFNLDTSWLLHNQNYKFEFKINELGTNRILSENLKFKVLRKF